MNTFFKVLTDFPPTKYKVVVHDQRLWDEYTDGGDCEGVLGYVISYFDSDGNFTKHWIPEERLILER